MAIFVAIYATLFGYQVYDYMASKCHSCALTKNMFTAVDKEKNLYEKLDLPSPYVSGHKIDVAWDKAKQVCEGMEGDEFDACIKPLKSAHKCLKRKRCRD